MTDIGGITSTPQPGNEGEAAGPPHPPTGLDRDPRDGQTSHSPGDLEEGLREARLIAQELIQEQFAEEVGALAGRELSDQLDATGKQLGVMILARMNAAGDTLLHEEVFRLAQEMVEEEHLRRGGNRPRA
jgi:hypothetical protein